MATTRREKLLILALLSLSVIGSALADWNILNQIMRKNVNGDSNNNSLKNYCESWRMNVELNNIKEFEVVPQECTDHIRKYMTSQQYDADSQTAVEQARLYLSSCCCLGSDGKDAWIFDVDDTLLSTVPYYKKHSYGGEKLNSSLLEEWMKSMKAPALDNTLNLYHEIRNKGVKIFLVSSRMEYMRSYTVDNLINVGYHGWTGLQLRGLEDNYKKVEQYKSQVRQNLIDEGYRILGIIGDQWSSFEGLPAAKRTFKLPNSMYYIA